jgi:uncharacterized protein
MDLVNEFTVKVPIAKAWVTLTDLELIAPCLPGAQLTEVEGETYRGQVKVKVGPIVAQFKGEAHFVEKDDVNYRAVLRGKGRDTGGKGNADALITAQLTEDGPTSTKVVVTTDLNITGKVAQFGRGALADVSNKLLGQFVDNLETTVLNQPVAGATAVPVTTEVDTGATDAGTPADVVADARAAALAATGSADTSTAPVSAVSDAEKPTVRKIDSKEVEPLDLLDTAGSAMLKRFAPVIGVALVVLLWLFRRRRH